MRIPDFKIKWTLLPNIPIGTEIMWVDPKGNVLNSTLEIVGWDNFQSRGEWKHPDLKETAIDLANGGCKIKESILRDLWLQQNGLPEKWAMRGCKELMVYYIKNGIDYAWGDLPHCFYYIKDDGDWGCFEKSNRLPNFDEITFDEFKKYYKQNKKEKMDYKISSVAAQNIISAVIGTCSWKTRLADLWGKDIVLRNTINVPPSLYNEMYAAANKEQKELLDSIFGKPKKEVDLTKFKKSDNCNYIFEPSTDVPIDIIRHHHNRIWLNRKYYNFKIVDEDNISYLEINYK